MSNPCLPLNLTNRLHSFIASGAGNGGSIPLPPPKHAGGGVMVTRRYIHEATSCLSIWSVGLVWSRMPDSQSGGRGFKSLTDYVNYLDVLRAELTTVLSTRPLGVMAATLDLKSSAVRRIGSNPIGGTQVPMP